MIKRIFSFISDPKTIICIFLCVIFLGIISLGLFGNYTVIQYLSYNQLLILKILSFVTYSVIAFFTYRGVKIARWLMAAIILISGIHAFILSMFGTGWHQYIMKPSFIILGIYFIFGGIVLFRLKTE
jgi:hypothetical protein